MRDALVLFLIACVVHGLWAMTIPMPVDWDPAYYLSVARNIAAGRGAVSDVVWNLSYVPASLPFPADLHWMPLPSRVLVPGLWLWPAHGDQLVTVVLAAAWAPLAWAMAGHLGATRRGALLAGGLAVCAGGYARFLSTPDSIALYGALGAGALLAAVKDRRALALALLAAATLTRTDGFLLGFALAWALRTELRARPWDRLAYLLVGPLVGVAWAWRCWTVGGPAWLALRRDTTRVLHIGELIRGDVVAPSPGARLLAALGEVPDVVQTALVVGVFLLPWPALLEAARRRRDPLVRAVMAYASLMPLITLVGAPGVAASGSPFRSGAALFPAFCALAALGLLRAGRWTAAVRGYPVALVPALVAGGFLVGSVAVGLGTRAARPAPPVDCALLASVPIDEPVFADDPLVWAAACGRAAVVLPADLPPGRVGAVADILGVHVATADVAERLPPGWSADPRGFWVDRPAGARHD